MLKLWKLRPYVNTAVCKDYGNLAKPGIRMWAYDDIWTQAESYDAHRELLKKMGLARNSRAGNRKWRDCTQKLSFTPVYLIFLTGSVFVRNLLDSTRTLKKKQFSETLLANVMRVRQTWYHFCRTEIFEKFCHTSQKLWEVSFRISNNATGTFHYCWKLFSLTYGANVWEFAGFLWI